MILLSTCKDAFRDALCLRYGWPPPGLPTQCVCGQGFPGEHALIVEAIPPFGIMSYVILMLKFCDVCIEPTLQPLSGESLTQTSFTPLHGILNICMVV